MKKFLSVLLVMLMLSGLAVVGVSAVENEAAPAEEPALAIVAADEPEAPAEEPEAPAEEPAAPAEEPAAPAEAAPAGSEKVEGPLVGVAVLKAALEAKAAAPALPAEFKTFRQVQQEVFAEARQAFGPATQAAYTEAEKALIKLEASNDLTLYWLVAKKAPALSAMNNEFFSVITKPLEADFTKLMAFVIALVALLETYAKACEELIPGMYGLTKEQFDALETELDWQTNYDASLRNPAWKSYVKLLKTTDASVLKLLKEYITYDADTKALIKIGNWIDMIETAYYLDEYASELASADIIDSSAYSKYTTKRDNWAYYNSASKEFQTKVDQTALTGVLAGTTKASSVNGPFSKELRTYARFIKAEYKIVFGETMKPPLSIGELLMTIFLFGWLWM
jgi:cell fate (sporulation/competence/biofilm development) regulator YlbF (YheA/YmcA/DUF963 family)